MGGAYPRNQTWDGGFSSRNEEMERDSCLSGLGWSSERGSSRVHRQMAVEGLRAGIVGHRCHADSPVDLASGPT